uniref:Importin subunit alpha n=1 Tax=Globodera pallida TaxID=36090 RepID=A0A183C7S4_GLOPA
MVLAAPSSPYETTSDDLMNSEPDSNADETTIQLVNKAKSSDPKERFAAVSRIESLLWKGAIDEVVIAEFVFIGVLPVLVNCLKSTDDKLLAEAASALSNIVYFNAREVIEAGAVPPLVKLLQSPNMELCKQISWALTNISAASPELALAVVEAGAVPLLVKLLQSPNMDLSASMPNMELCKESAWALKNISAASDGLALAVIETGAVPPLVKLLQSSNTDVCTQASLAIGNIIEKIPDLNGCCIDIILQDGEGLEGFVYLMNSEMDCDSTNTNIQLVNKAESSDPNERLAAVSRIRGLFLKGAEPIENCFDFLPVLVNCLKSTDEKLLVETAGALANIADREARDKSMLHNGLFDDAMHAADAGAVPLLVNLLQSPNLEVRKQTVRALANIACFATVEDGHKIVEAGAVPLLVNLLKSPNMQLCEYTILALNGIAYDKAREVVEAGAVPPLVKLLQSPNMKVCENAAAALKAIANDKAREVVKAGAVPLLVKLLQSPNIKVCENAAAALTNIAAASVDLALAVIEAGALPPLLNLLKSQNENVSQEAAWAIESIIEKTPDLIGHCIDVEHIQILARLQKIEKLNTKESEFIIKMIDKLQLSKGCVVCFDNKIDFAFKPNKKRIYLP